MKPIMVIASVTHVESFRKDLEGQMTDMRRVRVRSLDKDIAIKPLCMRADETDGLQPGMKLLYYVGVATAEQVKEFYESIGADQRNTQPDTSRGGDGDRQLARHAATGG